MRDYNSKFKLQIALYCAIFITAGVLCTMFIEYDTKSRFERLTGQTKPKGD
jgi:hypothetical protein